MSLLLYVQMVIRYTYAFSYRYIPSLLKPRGYTSITLVINGFALLSEKPNSRRIFKQRREVRKDSKPPVQYWSVSVLCLQLRRLHGGKICLNLSHAYFVGICKKLTREVLLRLSLGLLCSGNSVGVIKQPGCCHYSRSYASEKYHLYYLKPILVAKCWKHT